METTILCMHEQEILEQLERTMRSKLIIKLFLKFQKLKQNSFLNVVLLGRSSCIANCELSAAHLNYLCLLGKL